jgi:hypothetical protein
LRLLLATQQLRHHRQRAGLQDLPHRAVGAANQGAANGTKRRENGGKSHRDSFLCNELLRETTRSQVTLQRKGDARDQQGEAGMAGAKHAVLIRAR